jgi:hypothetical protein
MKNLFLIFIISFKTFALDYEGEAFVGGEFKYTEKHQEVLEGDTLLESSTQFIDKDGKVLAKLSTDHRKNPFVPEHYFQDLRSGEIHGLKEKKVCYRKESLSADVEQKDCVPVENSVASRGLHAYFLKSLSNFGAKDSGQMDLIVPGRLDRYKFVYHVSQKTDNLITFEVKLENILARMFAPSFTLTYDLNKNRLKEYRGPSNIIEDTVTIKYKYQD